MPKRDEREKLEELFGEPFYGLIALALGKDPIPTIARSEPVDPSVLAWKVPGRATSACCWIFSPCTGSHH